MFIMFTLSDVSCTIKIKVELLLLKKKEEDRFVRNPYFWCTRDEL